MSTPEGPVIVLYCVEASAPLAIAVFFTRWTIVYTSILAGNERCDFRHHGFGSEMSRLGFGITAHVAYFQAPEK